MAAPHERKWFLAERAACSILIRLPNRGCDETTAFSSTVRAKVSDPAVAKSDGFAWSAHIRQLSIRTFHILERMAKIVQGGDDHDERLALADDGKRASTICFSDVGDRAGGQLNCAMVLEAVGRLVMAIDQNVRKEPKYEFFVHLAANFQERATPQKCALLIHRGYSSEPVC